MMWQIRRIYLDAIGTPAARFMDVTLDLADGNGRPLDSILWLRNGGGKSTIQALVGALIRPARNDFLSATEHRTDAGRHLEDYVLGSDAAHIAVEWGDTDGRRLVTGAVYEWMELVQPSDPTASHDRLAQRWYSFLPDGELAELGRLPFRVAGRGTHQEAFCSAVRLLPPRAEPVVARTQAEWERTLASRGIDPDLWRTILQMNESEGGIEQQFIFADADEFVRYLLRLVIDPEIPTRVARILGQVITELASRPDVEADLRFCTAAIDRLAELDAAWRTSSDTAELVRIATVEARTLRASLLAASENAKFEVLEAHAAVEAAQVDAVRHRAASDAARGTADEYTRLAAVLRERAADARIGDITARLHSAELDQSAWRVAPSVVALADLAERRATLVEAVRAAEHDAAPLAERRVRTAEVYAIAIDSLANSAREQIRAALAAAASAEQAAAAARLEHARALREVAEHEARANAARSAIDHFDRELARARDGGLLLPGEMPTAGVQRLETLDSRDAIRGGEIEAAIDATRREIERDRGERDVQSPLLERARIEAETAANLHADLIGRRDALAADTRMALYLQSDDADVLGMGRTIREAIGAAIRRADGGLVDIALDGADDDRALQAIEQTSLLPPAPDLARAQAVLEESGISAVTGWRYLADAVQGAEHRLAAFLAAPELASGLLVQDPSDLGRARELLGDAGLRPTSLVALGTTAELDSASADGKTGRFAVPPNLALFDTARAAEERDRREAAADARATQRAGLEEDRELDRRIHDRLNALLRECPPGRLATLAETVAALTRAVAEKQSALETLDRHLREVTERITSHEQALRALVHRRRETAHARTKLEALVASENLVGRDRETLASAPRLIAAAKGVADAADLGERAAQQQITADKVRASSLGSQLDSYIEQRARLPGDVESGECEPPAGWTLDVLKLAWEESDAAWLAATSGSPLAHELTGVERRQQRVRVEVDAEDPAIIERTRVLLATPDGQDHASRSRAIHAADVRVSLLHQELGEANTEKQHARAEVELWETRSDRQRIAEEPASIEDALERVQQYRTEQERQTTARTAAEDRARRERERESDARVRVNAFTDLAGMIEVTDPDGAHDAHGAFTGTVEEARVRAREVSRSLVELRKDDEAARQKLELVANGIAHWASRDEWTSVKADVRSRFRTTAVAAELGPVAAEFREEIDLRRIELVEHLRGLDEHRANVITHGVGMVRVALRTLGRFSSLSKLPDELGVWSGQRFIDVGPRTPVDDTEAVMRDRVGRAVEALIAQNTAAIAGMELMWRALREVAGPNGFRARVLKPSPTFSTERISVDRMRKWSGGEKVTAALLLFVTVAKLRAANRGRELAGAGALMLDNPLGKANYVLFLELQRRVAARAGVQLVFLTGVADMKAVGLFPNVVRMRNAPDHSRRRGYVQVTGRDVADDIQLGRVDATRVYRTSDRLSLTLG